MWANSLLKQVSLHIKAGETTYQLELQNDLTSLIQRKNKKGRIYSDRKPPEPTGAQKASRG